MSNIFKDIKITVCLFFINIGIWLLEKEIKKIEEEYLHCRADILSPHFKTVDLLCDVKMFKEMVVNLSIDYGFSYKSSKKTIERLEKTLLRLDVDNKRCKNL